MCPLPVALLALSALLLTALVPAPVQAAPGEVALGPGGEHAAHRLIVTFSRAAARREGRGQPLPVPASSAAGASRNCRRRTSSRRSHPISVQTRS